MKIEQILMQPIGQRFNPGTLTIKTCKKKWQVKDVWWQQIIVMDETGEMPADVKIGKLIPLNGSREINVIVAEVQEAEYLGKDRKKLVVDQFSIPTSTVDEYLEEVDRVYQGELKVIRSKIKCLLTAAKVPVVEVDELLIFARSELLDKVVDAIIGDCK